MTDGIGTIFRLSDWGDTHSDRIEGLLEGCPRGLLLDRAFLAEEMARRAPDGSATSTQRTEKDPVTFLSGLDVHDTTTGDPIHFFIPNQDVKINEANRHVIRPSHASYTYFRKYGHKDNELCGRSSARETACRIVAGVFAKTFLKGHGVTVASEVLGRGKASREGDSVGATVGCRIKGLPAGLGEPIYDKFSARLAYAIMSINAAKGFEIGLGYRAAQMCGSEYNDVQNSDFSYITNHDGGIQAGITNGEEVFFTVAFKPVPTLRFSQQSIDFDGNPAVCAGSDRNDLCVVPRVLPVVEAMAAMVATDFLLISKTLS